MKKVNLLAAAVVAATFMVPAANATLNADTALKGDVSYFRAAVFSKHFDSNRNDVGRLGNESDLYIELAPGVSLAEIDNTVWDFRTSFAMQSRKQGAWQDTNGDLTFANTQAFMRVSGLFDFDPDAVLWVGKKYVRSDSFITDQFWRNVSGNGVGIENISLGSGKFSAHWVKNDIKDYLTKRKVKINPQILAQYEKIMNYIPEEKKEDEESSTEDTSESTESSDNIEKIEAEEVGVGPVATGEVVDAEVTE